MHPSKCYLWEKVEVRIYPKHGLWEKVARLGVVECGRVFDLAARRQNEGVFCREHYFCQRRIFIFALAFLFQNRSL